MPHLQLRCEAMYIHWRCCCSDGVQHCADKAVCGHHAGEGKALSRTATSILRKGTDSQADSAGLGTTLRKISTLMSRQTSTAPDGTPTIHEEEVGMLLCQLAVCAVQDFCLAAAGLSKCCCAQCSTVRAPGTLLPVWCCRCGGVVCGYAGVHDDSCNGPPRAHLHCCLDSPACLSS